MASSSYLATPKPWLHWRSVRSLKACQRQNSADENTLNSFSFEEAFFRVSIQISKFSFIGTKYVTSASMSECEEDIFVYPNPCLHSYALSFSRTGCHVGDQYFPVLLSLM